MALIHTRESLDIFAKHPTTAANILANSIFAELFKDWHMPFASTVAAAADAVAIGIPTGCTDVGSDSCLTLALDMCDSTTPRVFGMHVIGIIRGVADTGGLTYCVARAYGELAVYLMSLRVYTAAVLCASRGASLILVFGGLFSPDARVRKPDARVWVDGFKT